MWAEEILKPLGGELKKGANAKIAKGFVLGNAEKDLYPIKMKDTLLQNSIAYLQKIGVFPSGDDDDEDDEMVFGDDDFPCDAEEQAAEEEVGWVVSENRAICHLGVSILVYFSTVM